MQIENGRWVDEFKEPIDDLNFKQFKEVCNSTEAVYGTDITYDRINLIVSLKSLSRKQEKTVSELLKDQETLNKL